MPGVRHDDLAVFELSVLLADPGLDFFAGCIILVGDPRGQHERGRLDLGDVTTQIVGKHFVHGIAGGEWVDGFDPRT